MKPSSGVALGHRAIVIPLLLLLLLPEQSLSAEEGTRLIQVAVVTRHGFRTPKELYPADPWRSPKYWPEGWMQLTAEGFAQMTELGRILKRRYERLLPSPYTYGAVVARSSNTSRTINSAAALLSGLYSDEVHNSSVTPIPIIVAPEHCDRVINTYRSCPAYKAEMERVFRSPDWIAEERARRPLYEWLSARVGKKISSIKSTERVYTNYAIETARRMRQPAWVSKVMPEPITSLAGESMAKGAKTTLARRLRYGPLLKDILEHAQRANESERAGASTPALLLYSAHDLNLAGVLTILGAYDGRPPGFAACLLVEVRWNATAMRKQLRFLYRSGHGSDFVEKPLPDCGGASECPLADVVARLRPILPDDLEAECRADAPPGDRGSWKWGDGDALLATVACLGSFALGALVVVLASKALEGAACCRREGYQKMP